jgi:hypothetical protein
MDRGACIVGGIFGAFSQGIGDSVRDRDWQVVRGLTGMDADEHGWGHYLFSHRLREFILARLSLFLSAA